jgi:hypothetical protein
VALTRSGQPPPIRRWVGRAGPLRWWTSVVMPVPKRAGPAGLRARADVVACSGARQTFVPVTRAGVPSGRASCGPIAACAPEEPRSRGHGEDINRAVQGSLDGGSGGQVWPGSALMNRNGWPPATPSCRPGTSCSADDERVGDRLLPSPPAAALYDFDSGAVASGGQLGKLERGARLRHRDPAPSGRCRGRARAAPASRSSSGRVTPMRGSWGPASERCPMVRLGHHGRRVSVPGLATGALPAGPW